jgi:asparagine synthase (glutamine-hydrolysing)
MCGVAGVLDARTYGSSAGLEHPVAAMTATLAHRGPDASGVWCDSSAGVGLGHRRLSIIDLSPTGGQPMHSADGRFVLTYNGEIYNASELRAALTARGGTFRGHSDTEVLLEGCAAWGVRACLEQVIGMFAFALWDRTTRTLTLARDRLGIKPLYWAALPHLFLFGSELKALQAHPDWSSDIDRGALASYLRWGYVPAPRSIWSQARKLEPGQLLTVAAGAEPRLERYWDLANVVRDGQAAVYPGPPEQALDQLHDLLSDAVARRMVADVPLGAFLSGGIDSSTVVALMQAQSHRRVRTYSIGFREQGYDESSHARAIARHLGTDHTELFVEPRDALELVPRMTDWFDEPFADASQLPTYLLAGLTRDHVTVALSGDGGDELFAGYGHYSHTLKLWRQLSQVPTPVLGLGRRAVRMLSPAGWDRILNRLPRHLRPHGGGDRLHTAADHLTALRDLQALYQLVLSKWPTPAALVADGAESPAGWQEARRDEGFDLLTRLQLIDGLAYLPDDILTKVDRTTMAVGLEARVPLLDHRVVAFAFTLPRALMRRDGGSKWPLRQILYRYVPRALVDRPKMGFGVPLDVWLRGPLRAWAESLLAADRLAQEGLEPEPIRRAWRQHLAGERNEQYRLWTVLTLQAWLERDRCTPPAPAPAYASVG